MPTPPLSLVFVTGQLGLGGAERQLFFLVRELVREGHVISVITLNPDGGDYWEQPLVAAGARLEGIPRTLSRPGRLVRITKIVRSLKPDILHSWSFHTNVYAAVAARLAHVKAVLGSERSTPAFSREALGRFYSMQLLGLDLMVANSSAAAAAFAAERPGLAVAVVPNGVEPPPLEKMPSLREETRRAWSIPGDALVVGASGAMVPHKGFGFLLAMMAPLLRAHPNLHLVVAGVGPLREELVNAARQHAGGNRVIFPGAVTPLERAFAAFDIFCLPAGSRSREGMPNVVMEASSAALPVVASAVAGVPELVIDGQTGFLVEPDNASAFQARIEALLADAGLRARLGTAGRARMAEQFSVCRMVGKMSALYASLLEVRG